MSSSEQQETLPKASDPAVSPARSDKSSDSEGRPVREKFQKTSIDATANPISGLGQTTVDSANGSLKPGSRSASGSDSERGRLRRKRSREDVDDDIEGDKQPDKKHERLEKDSEKGSEKPARHARKRSRDITKDLESGALAKPATTPVSRIEETDAEMASPNKSAPKAAEPEARAGGSPKNKRPRDDTEGAEAAEDSTSDAPANGQATKASDERETKRVRDKAEAKTASSIPAGSGFANTSAASPFAAMAAKPAPPKASEKSEALPQTSDDKFKASGFASLANSSASPFGSFGAAAKGGSPFGGGAPKLSSFASPAATSSTTAPSSSSGFGALGSTKPSFGSGSGFGGASSSPFGGSFASKPLGGSSFATPGAPGITGLSSKPERAFGAPGDKENDDESDNEDDDDDPEKDAEEGRRPSQPLSSTAPTETGEEHEVSAWVGRAKLYTMDGEGKERGWKERGTGNIKLNVTKEEPKKARFVLRADGTHRLILNAAVTKTLVFGADSEGAKPKDGRLLFNSPNADGNLDMHLLKLKSERAVELWEQVAQVQNDEL